MVLGATCKRALRFTIMFHQVCHGTPAAARVEGRDEGTPDHNHARRRQGKDVRGEAEGIVATPAQVKSMSQRKSTTVLYRVPVLDWHVFACVQLNSQSF